MCIWFCFFYYEFGSLFFNLIIYKKTFFVDFDFDFLFVAMNQMFPCAFSIKNIKTGF